MVETVGLRWAAPTSRQHGFETGLLVDARPEDVTRSGPPVSQREETQRQTHSCGHGDHETRGHAPSTCQNRPGLLSLTATKDTNQIKCQQKMHIQKHY